MISKLFVSVEILFNCKENNVEKCVIYFNFLFYWAIFESYAYR